MIIDDLGLRNYSHKEANVLYEILEYDPQSGNIASIQREFGNFTYVYDDKNQLAQVSYTGTPVLGDLVNRTFTYDRTGNRINDTTQGTASFIRKKFPRSKSEAPSIAENGAFKRTL